MCNASRMTVIVTLKSHGVAGPTCMILIALSRCGNIVLQKEMHVLVSSTENILPL